ncbi:hypothetical protein REPUB_Repub10bG0017800 [Reevesia pubescens]
MPAIAFQFPWKLKALSHQSMLPSQVATVTVIQLVVIVTSRDSHQCASIAAKKRHKLLQSMITRVDKSFRKH